MTFVKKLLATTLAVGSALGALAFMNKVTEQMAGELDTVLTGKKHRYLWEHGSIFYETKGAPDAKPLVLIHDLSLGASSYEWRKNIDTLSARFRVFALDLLGFGLSDHPSIDYDAGIYVDLLSDFIKEVVGKSAVVVAHGTASAYAIALAYRQPECFERLVLISPPPAILEETYPNIFEHSVRKFLRLPIVGQFIYNLLTSRQSIRSFYDKHGYHNLGLITDELIEYVYTSAHQPGSRFAIAALFGKALHFDVHESLAHLQIPVVAIWGRESLELPAAQASAAFTRFNEQIEVCIFDRSRQYLQDEQAKQLNELLSDFAATAVI